MEDLICDQPNLFPSLAEKKISSNGRFNRGDLLMKTRCYVEKGSRVSSPTATSFHAFVAGIEAENRANIIHDLLRSCQGNVTPFSLITGSGHSFSNANNFILLKCCQEVDESVNFN